MKNLQVPLFHGIEEDELERLGLASETKVYTKNELVCSEGDEVRAIGVILTGGARIIISDFAGETRVMDVLGEGGVFGEELLRDEPVSDITVRTSQPSEILFIGRDILEGRLMCNLLGIISKKKAELEERLYILKQRTTREKLRTYLYLQAKRAGSAKFSIPFNRAELAEYLCVDRSAMSRELCSMRNDGMLEFYKSAFILNI